MSNLKATGHSITTFDFRQNNVFKTEKHLSLTIIHVKMALRSTTIFRSPLLRQSTPHINCCHSLRPAINHNTKTHHQISRAFSTQKPTPSPSSSPKPPNQNPGFESSSFKDMYKNSSRGVKIVLLVGLSLVATAETVAWCIWGWNKWGPKEEEK